MLRGETESGLPHLDVDSPFEPVGCVYPRRNAGEAIAQVRRRRWGRAKSCRHGAPLSTCCESGRIVGEVMELVKKFESGHELEERLLPGKHPNRRWNWEGRSWCCPQQLCTGCHVTEESESKNPTAILSMGPSNLAEQSPVCHTCGKEHSPITRT